MVAAAFRQRRANHLRPLERQASEGASAVNAPSALRSSCWQPCRRPSSSRRCSSWRVPQPLSGSSLCAGKGRLSGRRCTPQAGTPLPAWYGPPLVSRPRNASKVLLQGRRGHYNHRDGPNEQQCALKGRPCDIADTGYGGRTRMPTTNAGMTAHAASDAGQSFCRPWVVSCLFPALARFEGLTSSPAAAGRDLHARSRDEQTKDAFRVSWHKSTTRGSENKRRTLNDAYPNRDQIIARVERPKCDIWPGLAFQYCHRGGH